MKPLFENYTINQQGIIKNRRGHTMSYQTSVKGYFTVHLVENGQRVHHYVHRLVAQTFHPNPESLPEVNHKDFDKKNNHVDNLEWCTRQHNVTHAVKGGKYRGNKNCKPTSKTNARSGFKGVYFDKTHKRSKPYKAEIKTNRKKVYVGYFSTIEEAVRAREVKIGALK